MAGIAITSNGKNAYRGMPTGVGVDRGTSERCDLEGPSMTLSNPKNTRNDPRHENDKAFHSFPSTLNWRLHDR